MDTSGNFTILVTGATDGLGKRVATDLAAKGLRILLHGRNPDKGKLVLAEIRESTGNNRLAYFNADFSSLAEVNALAAAIETSQKQLNVLINNAGLGAGPDTNRRATSADGFEMRFAVNYLAPFLLTYRLLPLLRHAARRDGEARIINVASAAQQSIDFGDVMLERSYDGMGAYSQSKLAQVMFTFDLAKELAGSGITVNALHPESLMDTRMVREWFGSPLVSVEQGARHVERFALSDDLKGVTGCYFDRDRPSRALEQAYDEEAKRKLRKLTFQLVS